MDQSGGREMPCPEQMMACMATLADAFAEVREQALAELHVGPGRRLLDAGCGVGEFAIAVAPRVQPGGRVVGWLDLHTYDPLLVAAALSIPMFFSQGGRDY